MPVRRSVSEGGGRAREGDFVSKIVTLSRLTMYGVWCIFSMKGVYMQNFQRTQIYLEPEQIQQLKSASQKEQIPVSVLIRRAIAEFLNVRVNNKAWAKDSLSKSVGRISLKTNTASVEHDRHLYGA